MNWWSLLPTGGSFGAPLRHHSRCKSADTIHLTLHLTVHRFIQCWRLRYQKSSISFLETIGLTDASIDHGVRSCGATESVLARLYLFSKWASDRSTVEPSRLSVHPVVFCYFAPSNHPTHVEFGLSINPTVSVDLSLHAVYQVLQHLHRCSLLGTVGWSDDVFFHPFLCVFNL
jgi:hypothetical protein